MLVRAHGQPPGAGEPPLGERAARGGRDGAGAEGPAGPGTGNTAAGLGSGSARPRQHQGSPQGLPQGQARGTALREGARDPPCSPTPSVGNNKPPNLSGVSGLREAGPAENQDSQGWSKTDHVWARACPAQYTALDHQLCQNIRLPHTGCPCQPRESCVGNTGVCSSS